MKLERIDSAKVEHVQLHATLTYTGDGEPVEGATVTVETVTPAGTPGPTIELEMTSAGEYLGAVTSVSPGNWQFRATSEQPAATADLSVEVRTAPTSPPSTRTPATAQPVDRVTATDDATTGQTESNAMGRVLVVLGVVAAIVATLVLVSYGVRRRGASRHPHQ